MDNNDACIRHLLYVSYRFNRRESPHITPRQWEKVYGFTNKLEERYQKEVGHAR
jgi:hypothetical protein